jgi:hypothetical protein
MPAGWYEDTDPEALEVLLQLHRKLTPGQRLAQVFELMAFQQSLQRASVRAMYPGASEVPDFCDAFGPGFYADRDMVSRAVEAGRSFNIIHLASALKLDFFPIGNDPSGRSEMARRRMTAGTVTGLENLEFPVASPEDAILTKLVWFRRGGERSDRQWHNILGVARIQADRLDGEYLSKWGAKFGVVDLLSKICQ